MSADKNNQLFWLTYAQAVTDKAGAKFGDSGAFFVATEAQQGPVAGDGIPDEYTYQGLFNIGNNLLATDNLFYNPSALHSYTQSLQTFLNWVDLKGKPDANLDRNLLNAFKDQDAAQKKFATEDDKAFAAFDKASKRGLTHGQDYYTWIANGNAPAWVAANNDVKQTASVINQIQQQSQGAQAATVSDDRASLAKGLDQTQDFTGFNIHGAVGNVLSPQELLRAYKSGDAVPAPAFQRVPLYDAPGYKAAVQEAQRKSGGQYDPADKITFQIDTGKNTSDFKFVSTDASAGVNGSYGWFSFNASGSHSQQDQSVIDTSESSSTTVTLTFDSIKKVDISPGSWNIDTSKYELRQDAPKNLRKLARVSQLVIANRLGYEITVGSKSAQTIDTKFKESSGGSAGFSIFGIPIGLSGSGSHTSEKTSHVATWDNASKTLKVVPKDTTGTATVIGIVGEKLSILGV